MNNTQSISRVFVEEEKQSALKLICTGGQYRSYIRSISRAKASFEKQGYDGYLNTFLKNIRQENTGYSENNNTSLAKVSKRFNRNFNCLLKDKAYS